MATTKFRCRFTRERLTKAEVEIWRLVTDMEENKQALAVVLSLTGRASDSALEIPAKVLNSYWNGYTSNQVMWNNGSLPYPIQHSVVGETSMTFTVLC